jgi:hypothetical protein
MNPTSESEEMKCVWALTDVDGRKVWSQIGTAWMAGDLVFAQLDMVPLNGRLCLSSSAPLSARSEELR